MPRIPMAVAALILVLVAGPACADVCPPAGWSATALATLKAQKFVVADAGGRQSLAIALLACLDDPDPALRDGIAFESLSTWMRADQLTQPTRAAIRDRLMARLESKSADEAGFGQPFAALVLSEVARTDLMSPWMTPAERKELVQVASISMESIRDYRGFDEREGWRHGVAHNADLMMQLARNTALEKPELDRMLAAIATQVAPIAGHAYVDGEPDRLVRPVLYIAARGLMTDDERAAWFKRLLDPAPNASWADAYSTSAGLARRHDLRAFLMSLHLAAMDSEVPAVKAMATEALSALKALG